MGNNERKEKEIGEREVHSGYFRSVPVIGSIPVFKRTACEGNVVNGEVSTRLAKFVCFLIFLRLKV